MPQCPGAGVASGHGPHPDPSSLGGAAALELKINTAHNSHMNDPLTDEDAENVVLFAMLTDKPIKMIAQHLFMELPQDHSALRDYTARWDFQLKLQIAEKKLKDEQKKAHS
jgi:hypothetical protein